MHQPASVRRAPRGQLLHGVAVDLPAAPGFGFGLIHGGVSRSIDEDAGAILIRHSADGRWIVQVESFTAQRPQGPVGRGLLLQGLPHLPLCPQQQDQGRPVWRTGHTVHGNPLT